MSKRSLFHQAAILKQEIYVSFLNVLNDQDLWPHIKNNLANLSYIYNPSENIQIMAIKQDYKAVLYISKLTPNAQLAAINANWRAIEYMIDPTEEAQKLAVNIYPRAIEYISNPCEDINLSTVKSEGLWLKWIKNPSQEVILEAINNNPNAIIYVRSPSKVVQMALIKHPRFNEVAASIVSCLMYRQKLQAILIHKLYPFASPEQKIILREHKDYIPSSQLILNELSNDIS